MKTFMKNSRSGQITLLAILLGVVGLTIGLSVASRSLSDLKQASYVDFGTKALAAAEAGAEYGLYQLSVSGPLALNCNNASAPTGLNFTALNVKTLLVEMCTNKENFVNQSAGDGEVVQANLTNVSPSSTNSYYQVMWTNTAPAVEVAVVYSDYTIKRFAYNSGGVGTPPWNGDNFYSSAGPSYRANCPANPGSAFTEMTPAIGGVGFIPAKNVAAYAIMVRAKPLGGASTIQICGDQGLEPQSYVVTSTATTTNNVVKKVQVTREINSTLPSVFDDVIFSGGSLVK